MLQPSPRRVEIDSLAALDAFLESAPNAAGIFAIHLDQGTPYIARTSHLGRRLKRILGPREGLTKMLHLRNLARGIDYWLCSSRLESDLTFYEVALSLLPGSHTRLLRLRFPSYVKLITSNPFPRTVVTSKLSGKGIYFGPFRSRASAEEFEHEMLGLFQLRRCEEDLKPHPAHPGCLYGEMNMCLRPCQELVTASEYASEAARVSEFLQTMGRHLLSTAEAARDRLSGEMMFEEAAREHKRVEQIESVLKKRDDLTTSVDRLNGVAVTRGDADYVTLWPMESGVWLSRIDLDVRTYAAEAAPLDRRLREGIQSAPSSVCSIAEKQEHIALLARWYYSTWRDGEWIGYDNRERLSYRKLVHAVARLSPPHANAM